MSSRQIIIVAAISLVALGVGVGAGLWLAGPSNSAPVAMKSESGEAREPLFYRNPMNPTVTSPVPAKDSMGMDYIPVYADDMAGDSAIKAPSASIPS